MRGLYCRNRCPQCYHSYQYCICKSLPHVHLHENIQLIVYMDCKEVFNAGDDGKLLLSVLPKQSKRFIYGLEDEELVRHLGRLESPRLLFIYFVLLQKLFHEVMSLSSSRARVHSPSLNGWSKDHNPHQEMIFRPLLKSGCNLPSQSLL